VGDDRRRGPTARREPSSALIAGVVLAAGEASRFGATKQLVPLDGRPLVLHAVQTLLEAGLAPVVVVTGHDAERVEAVLPPDARAVRNERFRDGQASSLAAGLDALGPDVAGAVVLLADQPGVRPDEVRRLVERFRGRPAPIVRLVYRDGPGPALLARSVFAAVHELRGDVGARALIEAHPTWVRTVSVDRAAPRDVDRPEDLPRP
jgi:molybdenum cofactor cytidylyltransferase